MTRRFHHTVVSGMMIMCVSVTIYLSTSVSYESDRVVADHLVLDILLLPPLPKTMPSLTNQPPPTKSAPSPTNQTSSRPKTTPSPINQTPPPKTTGPTNQTPLPNPSIIVKIANTSYSNSRISHQPVCVCNGGTTLPNPIRLSSPFFNDNISLTPNASASCCSEMVSDDITHVFFSVRYAQYGHFLLNGVAPLWDKLRTHLEGEQLFIHLFFPRKEAASRRIEQAYLHRYMSLFSNKVSIQSEDALKSTSVLSRNTILGLSNITLDHYNYKADPALWKGFRSFLLNKLMLVPLKNPSTVRVLLLQRKDNREFLNVTTIASSTRSALSKLTSKQVEISVILLEGKSVDEQATVMGNADILIAADGTGLINGIYMPINSCIISFLPFAVPRLIPGKGSNFNRLFQSLGTTYITHESLEVDESKDMVKRAEEKIIVLERWFLLKQNIKVNQTQLHHSLQQCMEFL